MIEKTKYFFNDVLLWAILVMLALIPLHLLHTVLHLLLD